MHHVYLTPQRRTHPPIGLLRWYARVRLHRAFMFMNLHACLNAEPYPLAGSAATPVVNSVIHTPA